MDDEQISFLEAAKLDCAAVEELLDCYIDGEMIAQLKARFEEHLTECPTCADLIADCKHIVDVAKSLDDQPIPEDVGSRLRKALQERVGFKGPALKPRLTLIK